MNIAIVEDLLSDFHLLENRLACCLDQRNVPYRITHFLNGEDYINDFAIGKYDLLFLDIILGENMTGIDVAKKIRKIDGNIIIVFTTGERDYALEGFEVQALDYLVKPYDEKRVEAILERVLALHKYPKILDLQIGKQKHLVVLDDLIKVSSLQHRLILYMADGKDKTLYINFKEFAERLAKDSTFVCCTRGILVNLAFIDFIDKSDFVMKNGNRVPISRSKLLEMRNALFNFMILTTREGGV